MHADQPSPAAPSRPPIGPIPHYWADEASRTRFVRDLFDRSAPEYDRIEGLLAFGTGRWYRRDALRRAGLRPGMAVLDIATGTGLVAREASAIVGPAGLVVGLGLQDPGNEPQARGHVVLATRAGHPRDQQRALDRPGRVDGRHPLAHRNRRGRGLAGLSA